MTVINEEEIIRAAKDAGFHEAAFMDVKDLVIVPEFRMFCEENVCHCYNVVPACPPKCGTVEEMKEKVSHFRRVLVLQTEYDTDFIGNPEEAKEAKKEHNMLADYLVETFWGDQTDQILRMSAGPWKQNSCLSAYCVNVQKMAETVGMKCWESDGKCRFFSQVLIR